MFSSDYVCLSVFAERIGQSDSLGVKGRDPLGELVGSCQPGLATRVSN